MNLLQRAERAKTWLLTCGWPLWAEAGLDVERRGFHESLQHGDLTCPANFRRLRVLARHIYVFARAAEYGFSPGARLVSLGLSRLREARGEDGLYPWRFNLDHHPIDSTRDLYDHAFVLLALSAAAPVVGEAQVRGEALALLSQVRARFRHAAGGFVESVPPALPRRQNPHMHLLEALLAARAAFPDEENTFSEQAEELGVLFLQHLYLVDSGILVEFFDDDWTPQLPIVIEPGHHYEWVWLLDRLSKIGREPAPLREAADQLYRFADRHGVCPRRRVVRDQLDHRGAVLADSARLWPQTERLKAELCVGTPASIAEADDTLMRYLTAGRPGLWSERMDEAGQFSLEAAPASSLYHITCALTELIDFAESTAR